MAKTIFRKVGKRIIPLVIRGSKKDYMLSKEIYKSSAKIRKELKKQIAAKTSLSGKRIKAIRSVTNFLKGEKDYGKPFKTAGIGSQLKAFKSGKNVIKVQRKDMNISFKHEQMVNRFTMKSFLSQKKMAPETFMVSTSKRDYLVQKKLKKIDPKTNWYDKMHNIEIKFKKKAKKYGVNTSDLHQDNLGINKKRIQTIDSGSFSFKADARYNKDMWGNRKAAIIKKTLGIEKKTIRKEVVNKKQVENLNKALKKRKDQFWIRKKKK